MSSSWIVWPPSVAWSLMDPARTAQECRSMTGYKIDRRLFTLSTSSIFTMRRYLKDVSRDPILQSPHQLSTQCLAQEYDLPIAPFSPFSSIPTVYHWKCWIDPNNGPLDNTEPHPLHFYFSVKQHISISINVPNQKNKYEEKEIKHSVKTVSRVKCVKWRRK